MSLSVVVICVSLSVVVICVRVSSLSPLPQALALASGVMEKLGEPGHYTLFAPTNQALEKLGSGYLERIMGDQKIMSGTV